MKKFGEFVVSTFVAGLLLIVPIFLAVLLLLKAMQSVVAFVKPFALLLPEWIPAEHLLSLVLVLLVCFLIGVAIRTTAGRAIRERIEKSLFERIPGYALFRSLTFIIEELADGRFTVFVPSVPTPFAGAVYVLTRNGSTL